MNTSPARFRISLIVIAACLLLFACTQEVIEEGPPLAQTAPTATSRDEASSGSPSSRPASASPTAPPAPHADTPVPAPALSEPGELVQPVDLVYLGAFRLPAEPYDYGWGYSGYAMTYYPGGDPGGADDGFPGSLFILGHDQAQLVAEVSIPAPVNSTSRDTNELPTAAYLQDFHDITGGMFGELEIPRAGLEYLPAQGDQESGKLHFSWGQHFQFENAPSHGWSELDLSARNPAGPWHIAEYTNYVTNDYLFEIPEEWSNVYAPGLRLATGRFRDGSWGGLGPALIAIGPWNEGNPPPPGAVLQEVVPLLMYGENVPGAPELAITDEHRMQGYSEPDEWSGGAWLQAGDKSAVVLLGTKAIGESWYGFSNGVVYPISGDPDEEYPEVPDWPHDNRGWWSDDISARVIFFDPAQLGAVALGQMGTWQPQPYAVLNLDEYLFDPGYDYERGKRYLLGAAAFDRENALLYVIERLADEDERSLVHVFQVE